MNDVGTGQEHAGNAAAAPSKSLATLDRPRSLVERFAGRYGVEPQKLLDTLKKTAFKTDKDISNEQMMGLLVVADQYKLNPFTKEIFAFPDKGGIVPVVGVDGWSRIINEHPQFDGLEFSAPDGDGVPPWIECVIYRKDRQHPIKVREYFAEVKRGTGPWGSHPRRMLRHKALIQCARIAFGFAGIYDEDEAERIVEAQVIEVTPPRPNRPGLAATAAAAPEHSPERETLISKLEEAAKQGALQLSVTWGEYGAASRKLVGTEEINRLKRVADEVDANRPAEGEETGNG